MTLKEEVYQAVQKHVSERVTTIENTIRVDGNSELNTGALLELLRIQYLIYKMFADYNEKLVDQKEKPVRINTNLDGPKHRY